MANDTLPVPTWKRLGFTNPPDDRTSGQDVGIVILDSLQPHATLHHLGHRLTYVIVNNDLNVTCHMMAGESPCQPQDDAGSHGLRSLLLLSHAPFELGGQDYCGLAPAATFIVLNHGAFRAGEGARLRRGIAWLLERRDAWNIRLLLCMGWKRAAPWGWIENTWQKPTVRAMQPVLDAGILIVASNGNTRFENELPPVDYLAVGGFNDHPRTTQQLSPYPDEPWGRNGDGHLRPDVLAPMLYLPVPSCEAAGSLQPLSYFGQTSGAATLVTGICAHILSQYPEVSVAALRHALVAAGDPLPGSDNPAPIVNVSQTLRALRAGVAPAARLPTTPPLQVGDPAASVASPDAIERALALTLLAREGRWSRAALWRSAHDEAASVRKVAVWALGTPISQTERAAYWDQFQVEHEGGVRGYWAYGLLQDAPSEELDRWIPWLVDANWSVRWCVQAYLARCPAAPRFEMTFDPDLIDAHALPVRGWYRTYRSM